MVEWLRHRYTKPKVTGSNPVDALFSNQFLGEGGGGKRLTAQERKQAGKKERKEGKRRERTKGKKRRERKKKVLFIGKKKQK